MVVSVHEDEDLESWEKSASTPQKIDRVALFLLWAREPVHRLPIIEAFVLGPSVAVQ